MKILTVVAVAGLLGASAWAFQGGEGRAFFAERLASLGVTDAQKQQVKTILRQHRPTVEPMIHHLVAERRKLRDTIRADEIDEKAIRAQSAKVAGIEADLAVQRAHVVHEIKPVLTPEQIEKLKDMQVDVDERIDGFVARVAKRIAND